LTVYALPAMCGEAGRERMVFARLAKHARGQAGGLRVARGQDHTGGAQGGLLSSHSLRIGGGAAHRSDND
jgi:hypothetical protein